MIFLLSAAGRISIHAPRTGSDHRPACEICCAAHFNPRSPHGERLEQKEQKEQKKYFNPRSPHGERRPACPAAFF